MDKVIASTVYIEVEHRTTRRTLYTTATGFFITNDGYLITNEHAVADNIELGDGRTVKTKVNKIRIFVSSGEPDEREIEAKVLARDRDEDLALLSVRYQPKAWIDLDDLPEPSITDESWVVGYPLGDLLTFSDASSDELARPTVSVNAGRITAMRKDPKGVVKVIQTDAAVNYGNSGGPMVDMQGRLIGVVAAKVSGAAGLGFAIPHSIVAEFLLSRSHRIRFDPPRLYKGMPPLRVTVEPIFASAAELKGTVSIGGGGSPDVEAQFRAAGSSLTAIIKIQPEHQTAAEHKDLKAIIEIQSDDGDELDRRVFRLRSTRTSNKPSQTSSRKTAELVPQEQGPPPAKELGTLAGGRLGGEQVDAHRHLKDPDTGPTFVIDNSLMYEQEGIIYAEWRYEAIENDEARAATLEYEKVVGKIMRSEYKLERWRRMWNEDVWRHDLKYKKLAKEVEELRVKAKKMSRDLRRYQVCRCGLYWVQCDSEFCEEPVEPWIEDIYEMED